jgi:hypothetical protein
MGRGPALPSFLAALGVEIERKRAGGRVVFAGSVLLERSGTNGILWRFSAVLASPLPARRSSMSVILLKIKNQTGEIIFPATRRVH